MTGHRSHFINGQWIRGSGLKMASTDPASGRTIWEGFEARPEEIDAAVESAKCAFEEWGSKDLATRIYHLHAFKERVSQSKDILSEVISKETGKPLWDSRNEVAAIINKIGISIEAYGVRCPETAKRQPMGVSITRHHPHGVLAVLGPFNFPGHLPNGHIVPALLAGNAIVFKPSELTPLTAELMVGCWQSSGIPKGVLNLVQGGRDAGKYLSTHPGIDGLLFTGSWQAGRQLAELFGKMPQKILALEMGGNNPLVVSEIDDLEAAVYLTLQSAFLSSGQRCTCARRLIVPHGEKGDLFLEALRDLSQNIRVGSYEEQPEPFMGPVISIQTAEGLLAKQEQWLAQGGKALLKMHRLPRAGAFLSPGIVDVSGIAERVDEEVFGPLLQVVRVPDFDAAVREANHTEYGLVAGLLSVKEREYQEFFQRVKAGVVNWNTPLTGASSQAPFGGVGRSGNFRPSAFYAADYCAYPIASLEAPALKLPATLTPGIALPKAREAG